MNALAAYHEREIPRINQYLREQAAQLDPLVAPAVNHVLDAGGKRLRPLLTILSARAFGYEGDDVYTLACSLEFLHSATLLHDDILDGADLRRGKASAHTLFGRTTTILAGDALLALANRMVAELGSTALTHELSEAVLRTVTGEIREIAHMRDTDMPLDTYISIITGKTAYLIQAACRCGALLAGAESAHVNAAAAFGLSLGVAFQLVDDVLDYTSPPDVSGKPSGSDLREGKPTLPLLIYLESLDNAERRPLAENFRKDALSPDELEALRQTVVDAGFADRARETAQDYLGAAESALTAFPDTPETTLLREALAGMGGRDK